MNKNEYSVFFCFGQTSPIPCSCIAILKIQASRRCKPILSRKAEGEAMTKEKTISKASLMMTEYKTIRDSGILFDMPSCGGCRTCELACSFHHTQEFIPSASSLKVLDKEGGPGYQVLLVHESFGESIPCDHCKSLDVPLCMEYCKEADDLGKILLSFEEELQNKE